MSFLAPCPRNKLTEIALPDGCRVPHGALNKSSKGGQLLRSTSATPLPHQLEWFKREATLVSAELDDEEAVTLRRCFHDGIFTQGNYARSAGQHPADITGLAFAGSLVQMQHGALLSDVALEFCKWKQLVLLSLRSKFGEGVYVPEFFQIYNFSVADEDRAAFRKSLNSCRSWFRVYDFIRERLNVISLPVQSAGSWRVALLPNMAGANDADVSAQVGTFYELLALRQRMGIELTQDDVSNLATAMRAGTGGERAMLDYLIAKFAPRETREKLMGRGRAKNLISRYDSTVQGLRATREAAYLKVQGKTIKRTGLQVKSLRLAVNYEMQRVARKERMLLEVARRGRKENGWKTDEEFLTIIKDVVRGMGEASSKGATGATPEDADILHKAAAAFGVAGGKVDRIHIAVRQACIARFGAAPSRSTTYGAFAAAGIKFAKNVAEMAPVLQQHYCRARVLLYWWFFMLFSAWALVLSIDQKALYKANCDKQKGHDIQVMSERVRWAVTDKSASYDTLCSIALFSIWLLPCKSLSLEIAARVGLGAFIEKMKTAIGWTEDNFGERGGCAAAFGYVAAGKDLNPEDCEPETSARNQGAVDKFCTLFAEFCLGPDGKFVPFMLFILDNSKGPADKDFGFCLGLFFFIRNLDVCAAVSPAGKCSYEVPAEKVNGAEARRLRGSMVRFKAESEDPMGAAQEALSATCSRIDGCTFNGGGGVVHVEVASEHPTLFPWDAIDIKTFLGLSPPDKAAYASKHEQQWPGISDLYRKTFLYQMGLNTDGHVLYSHDSGSCIWRKREGCWAHEAWRGPRGMRMLLNLWPGGVPPSIVPSEERSGSYARPAERFDLRETYNEVTVPSDGAAPVVAPKSVVEPDAFNPRRICDRA